MVHPLIVDCLRKVSEATGIPSVASSDPHYPSLEDAPDQRTLVMINMRETEQSVRQQLDDPDNLDSMVFFGSNSFYIKSYNEMSEKFTQEELDRTNWIADQVEEFDITDIPRIPKIEVPEPEYKNWMSICNNKEDRYLMRLCVDGLSEIKPWEWTDYTRRDYWDRLQHELKILFQYNLSDYFLVVWDICQAAINRPSNHSFDWYNWSGKKDPITLGVGRGSAAGCLVSYAIGITKVDPLRWNLLFSRFYNQGRNTEDHIELADIDLDIDKDNRDWIVNYIHQKYGYIYPIITFGRIQGRAAIKDLFRVKGIQNHYQISNEICKYIPDEAAISDEIQQAKEEGSEDYGIIDWALDHSEELQEYRREYPEIFDQAIRLEGKYRNQGKHASGYVIPQKNQIFPKAFDTKSSQQIVGLEMKEAEKAGLVKVDLLGLSALSKLKLAGKFINDNNKKDSY